MPRSHHAIAAAVLVLLAGCGSSDYTDVAPVTTAPAAPADPGFVENVPVPAVAAFVDNAATNQQSQTTVDVNAGVRALSTFLELWQPVTQTVDVSTWSGLPGQGTVLNQAVHDKNIQYVVDATTQRTAAQATAAYLDDRQNQAYSIVDGMGPLTSAWRAGSKATTTITAVAPDATTVKYDDGGNGAGDATTAEFGSVVAFINAMRNNGSTEPSKRFFKYPRPWRWSSAVKVVPALEPAKSPTPATDGGFPSGHTNAGMLNSLAMAYAMPERFQEMISRGLELGENRILAGMHSPLDVMGGRMLAHAIFTGNINAAANTALKQKAYADAHAFLEAQTGTNANTLYAYAHGAPTATDRFADHDANKANYLRRLTFGFAPIKATDKPAVVPKGAEAILETRLPYLDAMQRRAVLRSTALPSGYPLLDDAEGWGRLNLFAAADGYGAFTGSVVVTMDATRGGFWAMDAWRNDISGSGKLTLKGTGRLVLTGKNGWTGGTEIAGGTLEADSTGALGTGDVYVGSAGTLASAAPGRLVIGGNYAQLDKGTLDVTLGANDAGTVAVQGTATIVGGTLHLKFAGGFKPAVGTTYQVLTAGSRKGVFANVAVDGYKSTVVYSNTGVAVRIDG
jgi:autotransporter-associated beta strand protein